MDWEPKDTVSVEGDGENEGEDEKEGDEKKRKEVREHMFYVSCKATVNNNVYRVIY